MRVDESVLIAKKRSNTLYPEDERVITRFYSPGAEDRLRNVIDRVMALDDGEVTDYLRKVLSEFSGRHRNFRKTLKDHFDRVKGLLGDANVSEERSLLIGSYFTMEYSIESAALFNPSIVPHPSQEHVSKGETRFIMSFRAVGEGHVSSIEFRSGLINKDNQLLFDPMSLYVETPAISYPNYNKHLFHLKLNEMDACDGTVEYILGQLPDDFTVEEAEKAIETLDQDFCPLDHKTDEAVRIIRWLCHSNYKMTFDLEHRISERVIFPVSESESRGIEDARFVCFVDDNGEITYYATYTAYNGIKILPQLIETKDFVTFNILTLNGKAVQNKGMALFPKKVNGKYVMLSRQDGESNYIMFSDNIHFWQEAQLLEEPHLPWQFAQIGNCGSPIETKEGWLLLIHGVGPMRKYCIGAELLDLDDPSKVIGFLEEPIIMPGEEEREGYVPNVVYTCGVMLHNDELVIPYSMADSRSAIAFISVPEIMSKLRKL